MYYKCRLKKEITFLIKADNEDDVIDWLYTHTADDVVANTNDYADDYSEEIVERVNNLNETIYTDYISL